MGYIKYKINGGQKVFDNESGISIYKAKELPSCGESVDSSAEHELVNTPSGRWEIGAW